MLIGIIAGETSGDNLGASLIQALRRYYPDAQFVGVAGPRMLAEGCQTLLPLETLSVMGIMDVIKHLPALLKAGKTIKRYFLQHPPDLFIGIDAPDFNLKIEHCLKQAGIPTVHYVSPSVWAWRQGRVKLIKQSVDLLLTLFPFENPFYQQNQVNVHYVGHPLADTIPLETSAAEARLALGLSVHSHYVALLPGSRAQEIKLLGPIFLQTALMCQQQLGDVQFLIPAANARCYQQLQALLATNPAAQKISVKLIQGAAQKIIAAADAVLAVSGTITLETLLIKRPLVVAYRMSTVNWWIIKRLVKIPFFSLPNLLANRRLVPEFIQDEATPEHLSQALVNNLTQMVQTQELIADYTAIHHQLRCNASQEAALAITQLLHDKESSACQPS